MMNYLSIKNIFALMILLMTLFFYFNFITFFKENSIDNVSVELQNLQAAYENAVTQLSLNTLKEKKNALSLQEQSVLENFVPPRLHSGKFVYDLAQLANQNRLTFRNIQYSVVSNLESDKESQRLLIEFSLDGRYEDFVKYLTQIERANVLVDVESLRGVKSPNSEIINFSIRMYTYAQSID